MRFSDIYLLFKADNMKRFSIPSRIVLVDPLVGSVEITATQAGPSHRDAKHRRLCAVHR